jgi:Holliday junction resolvase RusA-like endonuclease
VFDDPIIGGRRLSELVAAGMVDPTQARLTIPPPQSMPTSGLPIEIELPMPPTTNNLFLNVRGRGRIVSPDYQSWKESVMPHLESLTPIEEYPVSITLTIVWGKGWRSNSDVANREKATTDALVAAGILRDDSCKYVSQIISQITAPNRNGQSRLLVKIEPGKYAELPD